MIRISPGSPRPRSQHVSTAWSVSQSVSLSVSLAASLAASLAVSVPALLSGCGDSHTNTLPPVPPPPGVTKKTGMTYYKDIQPIMQRSCQGCHVVGGVGPFPLTTYDEALQNAAQVSSAVVARRMPPWKPADNCQKFQNARSLGQDAIDTVYSWVADGSPAGNPADAPPNMTPNVVTLDWVDATVSPAASYTPAANLTTDYHCFVLDPKLAASRDVIGYEVTPGAKQNVHHVLLYPADAATASAQDAKTPEVGWPCYGGPGISTASTIGGWVPGSPPTKYPTNTGITLAAGQVLVMQIHYDNHHGGAWSPDQTSVKIQFAKTPVAKKATVLSVRNASFSIPSGATDYAVVGTMTTPSDGLIYGLAPHAHQLGKRLRVETADTCLIDIPSWDFNWQQFYFYDGSQGLPFPKGTQIKLTCVYDNNTASPVGWGESTTDEMCLNYFYATGP
ncbi:MAG TPA: hypothetical protein PKL17_04745 [Pseudomonadota bacterium]|nr:hypothetical protein [Pseudomonadota bacterium]HNK44066.1 hypothetical protein [Pseudomonadota bacterium]